MGQIYTVSLTGGDSVPAKERQVAEARFERELERCLGTPETVAEVYKAWYEATNNDPAEVTSATYSTAVRWPKAFNAAQRAGLQSIGDNEAHFELQLARQHA